MKEIAERDNAIKNALKKFDAAELRAIRDYFKPNLRKDNKFADPEFAIEIFLDMLREVLEKKR